MKKTTLFLILIAWLVLLIPSWVMSDDKPKGNPPFITASFAVEKGYYGTVWRIYLEAHDPDGDMWRIAAVAEQLGYGRYTPDWIQVKSPYRKEFKGYLQWNTFSSKTNYLREWTQVTLTISIVDRAGNESNAVVFPFEFVSGAHRYPNPPAPFDQTGLPRLGYIHIDLIEPTAMGAGLEREE
ncbi:MAG: hypothetical protein FJ106_00490 [Deltaproteobacteria bacterium]|nr:hypothetical protein [Deltaproteobacteria bacterium]